MSSTQGPIFESYRPIFEQQYLKNGKTVKVKFNFSLFERVFNKMSNDNQADKHCIFGSLIINVESFFKKVEPQKLNFATFPGLS